jgi:hypothetical protein
MHSTLDGATPKEQRTGDTGQLARPATLAATPESINWTQTRHERDVAIRQQRIAVAAYLLSEARGFEPGHEAEDWLAAQARIDAIDAGATQV